MFKWLKSLFSKDEVIPTMTAQEVIDRARDRMLAGSRPDFQVYELGVKPAEKKKPKAKPKAKVKEIYAAPSKELKDALKGMKKLNALQKKRTKSLVKAKVAKKRKTK